MPLLVHATKQILDTWGSDGWELVQVVPGPNSEQLVAYLKRAAGMTPEERLAELGRPLPDVARPVAPYVPAVRSGSYVYTSGQLPMVAGTLAATGKVGAEVTPEAAKELAATCALNALAAVTVRGRGASRTSSGSSSSSGSSRPHRTSPVSLASSTGPASSCRRPSGTPECTRVRPSVSPCCRWTRPSRSSSSSRSASRRSVAWAGRRRAFAGRLSSARSARGGTRPRTPWSSAGRDARSISLVLRRAPARGRSPRRLRAGPREPSSRCSSTWSA